MKDTSPQYNNWNMTNFPLSDSVDKYETYLLNLNHVDGGPKAKFLKEVLGYTNGDAAALHAAVMNAINGVDPSSTEKTAFGVKYVYNTKLVGKNGNSANVVIVIQKDNGSNTWRVITIHPDDKD